jgi:hypothetical protein
MTSKLRRQVIVYQNICHITVETWRLIIMTSARNPEPSDGVLIHSCRWCERVTTNQTDSLFDYLGWVSKN